MEKIKFLNTYISNLNIDEVIKHIELCIKKKRKIYIVAVNTDVIVKMEIDPYLKRIVDHADITLADGKPLIWISKLQEHSIKEKVSGSDLVPKLCKIAEKKGYSIFILGGAEGVAKKAATKLKQQMPDINVAGTYSPPFGFEKSESELKKMIQLISNVYPDILIICFGCPKQEKYIFENYGKYNSTISVCAGATVDFLAGNIKRAPKWVRELGLEWLYRFFQEPKRLFKRYFIDDIKILKVIFKYRK